MFDRYSTVHRRLVAAVALAAGLAQDVDAHAAPPDAAQDGRTTLPIPYVERPLTLPRGTLAPDVRGRIMHESFDLGGGAFHDTSVSIAATARYGIVDDVEVELSPFESVVSPSFVYGASAAGTGRFVAGDVEVGGRLRVSIGEEWAAFTPSIPVRVHVASVLRVDASP